MSLLQTTLKSYSCPKTAEKLARFFKTGPGQYAEGDKFLGIMTPAIRKLSKEFCRLERQEIKLSLYSEFHEERLLALYILILQYERADIKEREKIYRFYVSNMKQVNNWDLVDFSAPHIIGSYLLDNPRDVLYKWVNSKNLWTRRISIVSTFYFIRNNDFNDTLRLAQLLLNDNEDLIHKATGWMLREVGKRKTPILEGFLAQHYQSMPRTMLRYAIEKFPEPKRQDYLKNKIKVVKGVENGVD